MEKHWFKYIDKERDYMNNKQFECNKYFLSISLGYETIDSLMLCLIDISNCDNINKNKTNILFLFYF